MPELRLNFECVGFQPLNAALQDLALAAFPQQILDMAKITKKNVHIEKKRNQSAEIKNIFKDLKKKNRHDRPLDIFIKEKLAGRR